MSDTSQPAIRTVYSPPSEVLKKRWPDSRPVSPEIETYVKSIVQEVRNRGDDALIELTRKFDGIDLASKGLQVSRSEIDRAYEQAEEQQISAIRLMKSKLERFQTRILGQINFDLDLDGVKIQSRTKPLRSVGCYVPGGRASYPSTLMMTVTPARVANVPRIAVCSPAAKNGEVNPLILVAADLCEVNEVYKIGGAQAIAALAYGTASIKPVDKIVGPGNAYVTAAKMVVSRDVSIDLPAGPSEILVLADESSDPRLVALDMISQAEHGGDSVAVLVTTSRELAGKVAQEISAALPKIERHGFVAKALFECGLIFVCRDWKEGIDFVNEFAPEHVEVITKNAETIAQEITSAGIILIGPNTPVSASDYCLGTNHVLPTGGFGKRFSGLSALDYVRRCDVVWCSADQLQRITECITTLAEAEGLPNHGLAVEERLRK